MQLKNPFSQATRELFRIWECWECGQNGTATGGLELHHITGRTSSSPFNAAPLCHHCHERVTHAREEEARYFLKTQKWLLANFYQPTDKDLAFVSDHYDRLKSPELTAWLKTKPKQESSQAS